MKILKSTLNGQNNGSDGVLNLKLSLNRKKSHFGHDRIIDVEARSTNLCKWRIRQWNYLVIFYLVF